VTVSIRRYAAIAAAIGLAGAALLLRGNGGDVAPERTTSVNPVSIGAVCSQVPDIAVANPDERLLRHVLDRAGYGPRPGDIEQLRQIGIAAYLTQQLTPDAIPDAALDARLASFETQHMSTSELVESFYQPLIMVRRTDQFLPRSPVDDSSAGDSSAGTEEPDPDDGVRRRATLAYEELRQQKLLRAIASERQLQEVLVDVWFNHFNVAARKGVVWLYLTEYERDAIRPHVLGRFRDLLGAVAESPAMLFYLDNWLSSDPDGPNPVTVARDREMGSVSRAVRGLLDLLSPPSDAVPDQLRRAIYDRQRAPGLNENYARELLELHTLGVDGGYTQADVVEVARAFTGWTLDDPGGQGGGFVFEPRIHATGEKTVLGTVIEGGGQDEGLAILDLLARHPSTARLVATKLARRFVADDPPASVVDRAAACFLASGGQLKEVVRTILLSPEFLDSSAYGIKVKTPLEFVVSAVRAIDADVQDVGSLVGTLRQLGMPSYEFQPPTGYPDRAEDWVNAGALLARMDFAVALAAGQVGGVVVDTAGRSANLPGATPEQLALTLGASAFQRR
jgi:uncharacterized protein (DUF1800 family)